MSSDAVQRLAVDTSSEVAPYEQVRRQIAALINAGELAVGAHLPPVRALATQLGLAANTAARVYRELEAAGMVETRGRGGTVVTATGDSSRRRVHEAAQQFARAVLDTGIDRGEAERIVGAALDSPS